MAQPRNKAVIAGLAAALTLGGVTLPAVATTSNDTTASDSDPNGMGTPLPSDYDKTDYYEGTEGVSTFASTRSASSLSPVALTDEMKYFTLYESGRNYDKGLSSGDGYNAMGYYQFDRRYALVPFLQQVYAYNPQTYGMLVPVLAQADTLSSKSYSMYDYDTRQLTALAQQLNEAWHAAYAANPAEFSALQDSYAYNNYYLPVQSTLLNNYGVDLRNRADCVKGLAWSMCNLFGNTGAKRFFDRANLSNGMTDREMVTALCDAVVNNVADLYSSQPQYHRGWQNRFRKEKAECLKYIEQHEAEQAAGGQQNNAPNASGPSADAPGAGDAGFGSTGSESGTGTGSSTGTGSAAGSTNGTAGGSEGGSTNGATGDSAGGPASGSDAGSDSNGTAAGGSTSGSTGGSTSGSTSGSSGSSNSGSASGSTQGGTSGDGGSGGGTSAGGATQQPTTPPSTGDGSSSSTTVGEDVKTESEADADAGAKTDDTKTDDTKTDDAKTDGDKKTSEKSDDAAKVKAEKTSDKKAASRKTPTGDLPLTGDDAALVVTGAAGLAIAGASFLSLAKKERDAE